MYAIRIVSMDRILRFTNTLVMIIIDQIFISITITHADNIIIWWWWVFFIFIFYIFKKKCFLLLLLLFCFHGSTAINCLVNHAFNKFIFCQKCTHYLLWPIIKIYMYSLFFNREFSLIYNRITFSSVITKRRKQTKRQLCRQSAKGTKIAGGGGGGGGSGHREKREKKGERG